MTDSLHSQAPQNSTFRASIAPRAAGRSRGARGVLGISPIATPRRRVWLSALPPIRFARVALVLAILALAIPIAACATEASLVTGGDDADLVPAGAVTQDSSLPGGTAETSAEAGSASDGTAGETAGETAGDNTTGAADGSDDAQESDTGAAPLEVLPSGPIVAEGEIVDLPDKPHPLIGQPAPDFTMTNVATGEEVSLSDFAGQPVLVNFWATWCPPCRLEMPWFENAYQQHKDEGFVVLAVDAGETNIPPEMVNDVVMRFVDGAGLTFPVLLGDNAFEVQQDWSVAGLPSTFLVDRDGIVAQWHASAYPNQVTLEYRLQAILGTGAGE